MLEYLSLRAVIILLAIAGLVLGAVFHTIAKLWRFGTSELTSPRQAFKAFAVGFFLPAGLFVISESNRLGEQALAYVDAHPWVVPVGVFGLVVVGMAMWFFSGLRWVTRLPVISWVMKPPPVAQPAEPVRVIQEQPRIQATPTLPPYGSGAYGYYDQNDQIVR